MVMNPYKQVPRKSEWGLFAYVIALAMEEIRQVTDLDMKLMQKVLLLL